ncbi:MAG: 50S ribosomal protein L4 [Calditrichaeota bacterium]|nr:50S ribosomal protein L4 [Calditrichota bacterium]TDI83180.1 MAG: 50S ribosomal protein L4 [Caldithrix sp.]
MELEVYKTDGTATGKKIELPAHIFAIEPNEHVVYLAVKVQQTNSRQGNASSKTRSMVRGGGKKPFRQKGRGAARAGSTRSPVWVGGGRIFGPHPRDYKMSLPTKLKVLARKSVYTDKVKNKQVKLVEDFKLEAAKTKEIFGILTSLGLAGEKTLLLLSDYDADVVRAGRNIPKLEIRVAASESTYDLLNCKRLLLQAGAIEKLSGAFKK